MKPNFNNCYDIKGLRYFTKEICPYHCRFLHTQKDSGGASIHRIDELFPLKPSLGTIWMKIEVFEQKSIPWPCVHSASSLKFIETNWDGTPDKVLAARPLAR